jgi:60 kDa SS-A/Ro ribonucleoprotein
MGFKYANATAKTVTTPATSKIVGREKEMIANDGGGYSFKLDDFKFLTRFLILGATEGTFYLSKDKHEYRNLENVINCIQHDGCRVVREIVRVSNEGLAHKNDHAIFALALVFRYGDNEAKALASTEFNKVVRIGTHMFMFCDFIKKMRGFGKTVRQAINNWYTSKDDYSMAFQISKYQQREGWSHRDVFRLSHPAFGDSTKNVIAQWAMGKNPNLNSSVSGLDLLHGVELIKMMGTTQGALKLIETYKLQREHIPTELLNKPEIQEAMLPHMGGTALLRNLGNMSKSGLVIPFNNACKFIINKLGDREWIKKNRLHPLSILNAQRTYAQGHGVLGNGSWTVNQNIVDALEDAFYLSFDTIEPTGKNFFYGIDISGSMAMKYQGMNMTCNEVAAVLAMAHVRTENNTFVGGFGYQFQALNISKKDTLETAAAKCQGNFGSTNPGSAIEYAISKKIDADAFIIITDNDINSGSQPTQVLNKFRKVRNKPQAKMIVCGLVANNFSIADPADLNQLDIAGFSPDITTIITNFVND